MAEDNMQLITVKGWLAGFESASHPLLCSRCLPSQGWPRLGIVWEKYRNGFSAAQSQEEFDAPAEMSVQIHGATLKSAFEKFEKRFMMHLLSF